MTIKNLFSEFNCSMFRLGSILLMLALTGCGGGGGAGGSQTPSAPVASSVVSVSSAAAVSSSSESSSSIISSSASSDSSVVLIVSSALSVSSVLSSSSSSLSSSSLLVSSSSSSRSSSSSSSSSLRPLSKIEIRIAAADDWAYLTVNGLRHRIGYWGQPNAMGDWRDVSEWFVAGNNDVQIQAINSGGPRQLIFDLRVNGIIVSSYFCPSSDCPDGTDQGTFLQKNFTLFDVARPAAAEISIASPTSGKLYINDEYVRVSTPATLTLPKGTYKIGLGISNDNPFDLTDDFYENILALGQPSQYNLMGAFYERTIVVEEGKAQSVYIDPNITLMAPQNTVKIAILPFQSVMSKDMTSPLVMSQAMLDGFAEQVKVTGERLAAPTMYGLSKWEVTVLPWDTILNVNATDVYTLVGDLYSVSWRPEYQHLFDKYDTVIVYQSSYHADGVVEPIFAGGMTSSGRLIHVTSGWTWTLPSNAVNRGLYHEMYHQYEFWETANHHYYNGIGGLHGQRLHGFTGNGASVQEYYRLFARGQAGEDYAARADLDWPVPLTNGEPFPIGVFHAVRYGRLAPQ